MCNIVFNLNIQKALEVILYLSNRVNEISSHTLLKMLFFADVYHLNEYGRPIIGDDYNALKFGPVASTVYDIIQKKPFLIEVLAEEPFNVVDIKKLNKRVPVIFPERDYNEDCLSLSDREALDYSIKKYINCNFDELTELSHQHPAWQKAWSNRVCSNNPPMHYEDFIAPENQELLEELQENSKYICL